MPTFKEQMREDISLLLNLEEFAELRTVRYDGESYQDIPVVLEGFEEKDRRQLMSDHVQGLYLVSAVLYCARDDLGGCQPEKGKRIYINDEEGGSGFFRGFYVTSSACELGMLRVELEAIDE